MARLDSWCGHVHACVRLGEIQPRYKHILVISGNHEWFTLKKCAPSDPAVKAAADPKGHLRAQLSNATHVLEHQGIVIGGLRIFGSGWMPWSRGTAPEVAATEPGMQAAWAASGFVGQRGDGQAGPPKVHRFDEIPGGCDVLMTHGPPHGVLDMLTSGRSWGSSEALTAAVQAAAPLVHCFGHLHEQRGLWTRADSGQWVGGVEYEASPGVKAPTWPPPPPSYPGQVRVDRHVTHHATPAPRDHAESPHACPVPGQIISNNAMKNHPGVDKQPGHIAGGGRLLVALPVLDEGGQQRVRPASGPWPEAGEWRFLAGAAARAALGRLRKQKGS